jgi:ammonia channel protein AmtB
MNQSAIGLDVFFLLVGAVLVFSMHGGFAFLELGTVRGKNQVNALVKIIVDFAFSTLAYFFVGYWIAYGVSFFAGARTLSGDGGGFALQGLSLVRFFFLATFAAAVPAIISGGIAERAKFWPQVAIAALIVGLVYPLSEGIVWNANYGIQAWLKAATGAPFHDFAGSIVVHAVGGWLALAAVRALGARNGRYGAHGRPFAPSSIPWLALGTWMLSIGWFGFNVMSAQSTAAVSGLVALVYPFFEGIAWNGRFGIQAWLKDAFGAEFHDFAGSVVVHAMGGFIALVAVLLLGARRGRYAKDGGIAAHPPSSIPFLALGAWVLSVGWFGFNVMSAQTIDKISGLVAINSLMAMAGGTLAALFIGRNDPGFVHNGPLAGLVAICAGSDVMHPIGALATGAIAGALFVVLFTYTQNRLRIDDVLGVWPLHGLCGAWGGLAAGIFGATALGGLGGVAFASQLAGTLCGIAVALAGSALVYGALKATVGLRLDEEEEFIGADLAIHRISSTPNE